MTKPIKISCVVGTRPEAIKLAPVIRALQAEPRAFRLEVIATAQHRGLLDQVLAVFEIQPDLDLDIMEVGQTLSQVTARVLERLQIHFEQARPDIVLAQGDTTTVMATAMACFYNQIPFGHVEAGLRTGDLQAPFPEEFNRRVAGLVSACHFAPTEQAAKNLLREGIPEEQVHVTGNTVIDALHYVLDQTDPPECPVPKGRPYILMTCHRRENFGEPVKEIFDAVRTFAEEHPDYTIWYPVHPNPQVAEPARELLGKTPNVLLSPPLDYVAFSHAMHGAHLLLTDSGGIQEEAPGLGKPVLVLREVTERPEGVEAGTCRLVGSNKGRILSALDELVGDTEAYEKMAEAKNPYGDGRSGERIVQILKNDHQKSTSC